MGRLSRQEKAFLDYYQSQKQHYFRDLERYAALLSKIRSQSKLTEK